MGLLSKVRGKVSVGASDVGGVSTHVRRARINGAASGETAAVDLSTGQAMVVPAGAIIDDCFIVVSAAAGDTIEVGGNAASGAGDDPDGLLDAVSIAATGTVRGSLAAATPTRGAMLRANGYSAASPVYSPQAHVCDVACPITYTNSTTGGAALKADLVVVYRTA